MWSMSHLFDKTFFLSIKVKAQTTVVIPDNKKKNKKKTDHMCDAVI